MRDASLFSSAKHQFPAAKTIKKCLKPADRAVGLSLEEELLQISNSIKLALRVASPPRG